MIFYQMFKNKHFEEFSEAAQVKFLTNVNNKMNCHFEFEISELGKLGIRKRNE